jgi:hypothetical protein
MRKLLVGAGVALGLALSGPVLAGSDHSHPGHGALKLTLNKGQKWETDEPLRKGMSEMRNQIADALGRIHAKQFKSTDYVALADGLQTQVDYVTANCKLPGDADAQLHVVLTQILEGIDALRTASHGQQGAKRVAEALKAYGRHFNHPYWISPKL